MDGFIFYLLTTLITISELVVIVILMYYYAVSVFGWQKIEEKKDYTPEKKFALITAAHNEAKVIKYHLESLKQIKYPEELFDIYVIADNCTDETAEIARQAGAHVFERFSEDRGKGFAIEYMLSELFKMEDKGYDAVCMFDADNLVSSNFLSEMNAKLKQGFKSIQGYLDIKNPNDSWVTACYATAYWSMNRMWQLARYNLGLSNALGGTGLCLDINVLKEYGWGAHCLTEDLEFTMKLLQNGIKTAWAHDCRVYDEKPVHFNQTWKQRTRWLQGHWDVAFRYMVPLIKKGIKERKWYPIDGAIYLFQPFLILAMFLSIIISIIGVATPQTLYAVPLKEMLPNWFFPIFAVVGYTYPMLGLYFEKAPKKAYLYYITYPIYGLTWFPVTLLGLLKRGNQTEWAHTQHTREISISSLERQ